MAHGHMASGAVPRGQDKRVEKPVAEIFAKRNAQPLAEAVAATSVDTSQATSITSLAVSQLNIAEATATSLY